MVKVSEKLKRSENEMMVRTGEEKDRGRCSNENIENGSGWIPKDMKTKTEVERLFECLLKLTRPFTSFLTNQTV